MKTPSSWAYGVVLLSALDGPHFRKGVLREPCIGPASMHLNPAWLLCHLCVLWLPQIQMHLFKLIK